MIICGGYFDIDNCNKEIQKLQNITMQNNFWDDRKNSEKIINELNQLKNKVNIISNIKNNIYDNIELLNMCSDSDIELIDNIYNDYNIIEQDYKDFEIETLFNGEYDNANCILEIHSGAGGTESCDWVQMLFRMYNKYCERRNFKLKIIDVTEGEEAGLKSISALISGKNAYGYLKSEKGVHRLVRISPFDSNSRRHTSFASVVVTPQIDNNKDIIINDNDIRIDVYRSSGCGGQGVNTTDSAVRITHIPTGIVVTCQNERSQIKNKEIAMNVLKSKLKILEDEKNNEKIKNIQGNIMANEFGSQIRSYVMHPYSMVKDHRTNYETSNVDKVMDGYIDDFIYEYLRKEV